MESGPHETAACRSGSYKFQRLREQLRQAVQAGELSGKLPGERELARRYQANAKTISKALTDLSSEGLLVRQVGRGTFVAGQFDERYALGRAQRYHWLVRSGDRNGRFQAIFDLAVSGLRREGHQLRLQYVETDQAGRLQAGWLSPGKLREVDGVVIFSSGPSDDLHRRRIPLVLAACTAGLIKSNAVHPDWARGAFELTEQLIWTGHRRITLATPAQCPYVAREAERGYRAALARYGLPAGQIVEDTAEEVASAAGGPHRPSAVIGFLSETRARLQQAFGLGRGQEQPYPTIAVVLPPGEAPPPPEAGLSYGFNREAFVDWTVRLLMEAAPGHQPREVILPGRLTGHAARPADEWPSKEVLPPRAISL